MACSRNIHRLFKNRTFSIPKHEQRYIFFYAEDKIYGVMADWTKSVQNKIGIDMILKTARCSTSFPITIAKLVQFHS
jgi:hypothetical protein